MELGPLDYLNGILTTIAVITGVIVGLIICSRYFKYNRKDFLYIGISFIGMYQPWWPIAISFISILLGWSPLSDIEHFFIGTFFIPIFITTWMIGMTSMLELENKKALPVIYIIISVLADVYLVYFLINDPSVIGKIPATTKLDVDYKASYLIYLLFISLSIVITGILFSIKSLKSEHRYIRLKGKLLIIGFVCYLISGFMDGGIIPLTIETLIIARLILISNGIFIYFGFFLPDFIKKRLGAET